MSVRPNETIESLIANKRYKEALQLANEEVRRHPGDLRLLNLCANIYLTLRKEDTAARLLRRVADVHAANGSPAKAVVALKKIERIGRDDPTMYESLASRIEEERTEDSPVHFEALNLTEEELEAPKTLETLV
ncbi:MAG: tetratricopeptide repeat protein, partial [Thermoanaerobaculia bacterium]